MYKISFFAIVFLLTGAGIFGQSTHVLWYNKPAEHFEESLVLGNGKVGATVFGGPASDKIFLNDITLWSGEPVNANMNPEAYKNVPEIRAALLKEDYALADKLNKKLQGTFSESYAPLGTMYINSVSQGEVSKYYRELNISTAISKTTFDQGGIQFTRVYFVSAPDQVFMIKLTSSKAGGLSFDLKFNSLLKYKTAIAQNVFTINGYAPVHAEPSYRRAENPVVFEEGRGTRFNTLLKIKNNGGVVTHSDSTLGVKNATEAIIYVSIATSFNGFDKNPASEGLSEQAIGLKNLTKAYSKTYGQIKQTHILDYQKYLF